MRLFPQSLQPLASLAMAAWLFAGPGLRLQAETYSPPGDLRVDTLLDADWRFIRQDVAGAQDPIYDDSAWSPVILPHTWNNLDGQDGGNNYYRGVGWYRRHFLVSAGEAGRRLFLKFDAANIVTDVYLNGSYLGQHRGGFAAFVFDVSANLNLGGDNVLAVKVSNAAVPDVAPQSGDFTFFGGLYRDVHLLSTDALHISPLDYGSPGVYLATTNVSAASADLQITTVVSNASTTARSATVRVVVVDAATTVVMALTNTVALTAGTASNVFTFTTIPNPHLWDGLNDPYLYRVFVELAEGATVADWLSQPLGFRWFSVDPATGFYLNGRPYDLHGVNLHQDWLNRGWAIGNPERQTNFAIIKDLGATVVRLSHYQHDDYTYQLADEAGVVLWSEVPLINGVGTGNFNANAEQQMVELIRQRRNHPAVICWGTFNEESSPAADTVISQLVQVVHREDPTRPAVGASNKSISTAINWMPDLTAFNEYFGWYGGATSDFGPWADALHAAYPARCVGISEYGAGASIIQHAEEPLSAPAPFGTPHPEEWQNKFHEDYWLAMKQRPFLWLKTVWNLCDFAVDSRNEGDTPGRNDKGLVTYDRQVRKDAFYWYKANWTTNPLVYITGHTFTNRLTNSIKAKAYANCDSVELFLNGASQGVRSSTSNIFTWPVTLRTGSNFVQAVGVKGPLQAIDSLAWFAPLTVSITNPTARTVFLSSTNELLRLAASTSDPTAPAFPRWTQTSGPGPVTFGSSNALVTTARFGAEGIYGLLLTVSNVSVATAGLTVVVNPAYPLTNGLLAWWKMDETGGPLAADSSGNGRAASVVNAGFTTGYISNALQFNGSTSYASYTAQDTNQLTVAVWVRAAAPGNSQYPRIVEAPGFRLMFRLGGADANSVGFASFDTTNGDWDSGGGSIALGSWYHIAVSYDRTSQANVPVFYINGSRLPTVTLTMPSGTRPPYTGTGYIGNRAALDRAWNGLIDDLRLYNRLLSPSEIQALAAMPPRNIAPRVNAGSNQTAIPSIPFSLSGTVADDGLPNPPGVVTTTWSCLGGPGAVTFDNPNAVVTRAVFPSPGAYVLQLLADDGEVQVADVLTVTALNPQVLGFRSFANHVELSWPADSGPWRLQVQTNAPGTGLGTNWIDVPGSTTNNSMSFFYDPANGSSFYRLVYP